MTDRASHALPTYRRNVFEAQVIHQNANAPVDLRRARTTRDLEANRGQKTPRLCRHGPDKAWLLHRAGIPGESPGQEIEAGGQQVEESEPEIHRVVFHQTA